MYYVCVQKALFKEKCEQRGMGRCPMYNFLAIVCGSDY